MNILSGFDLVIELDRLTLFNLVRSHPLMAPFRTPFEFSIEGTEVNGGGKAHFVFVDSDLFLRTGNIAEMRLYFEFSSIIGNRFVQTALEGRDLTSQRGSISILAHLSIEVGREATARELMIDLLRATVAMHFERSADDSVSRIQSGIEILLVAELQARVRAFVGGSMPAARNPRIPLAISVGPTPPAGPTLLVTPFELQLRTVAPRDPELQSLVLFAMFQYVENAMHEERTQSYLPAGTNVAFTLSPWAFHNFISIPVFLRMLEVARRELLPAIYGRSESVPDPNQPDWSITQIEASLRHDAVGLFIQARHVVDNEPFQSTTHGDLHGHLSMTIDRGGRILPSWITDSVTAFTTWGPGWWFIGAFGPYLLMALVDIFTAVIGSSGRDNPPSIAPIGIPLNLPGARLGTIEIESDHFSVAGTMSPRPARGARFRIYMSFSYSYENTILVDTGVYNSRECPEGDYPYNTFHRTHKITFSIRPELGSYPIGYKWLVNGNGIVTPGSGSVHISVISHRPDPPASAGVVELDLAYEISVDGSSLTLTVLPEHGNFQLNIVCNATDADGRGSTNHLQYLTMTRNVIFGGTWDADFARCMRQLADGLNQRLEGVLIFPDDLSQLKIWPPEPGKIIPSEIVIAYLLEQAIRYKDKGKEKDTAMVNAMMKFGPSLETNLQLPPWVTPEIALQVLRVFSKEFSGGEKGKS